MDDNDNKPYYEKENWMSPEELTLSALKSVPIDTGISAMLTALAVVRTQNSVDLEILFFDNIQQFLRNNVPGYDELAKRRKAGLN